MTSITYNNNYDISRILKHSYNVTVPEPMNLPFNKKPIYPFDRDIRVKFLEDKIEIYYSRIKKEDVC